MELIRLINKHVKCNVTNPQGHTQSTIALMLHTFYSAIWVSKSHSMHVYKFSMHVCASFLDLKACFGVHNMNMGSKWKYI